MPIQLQLGLESILSYKRLSYTPWHALAEFVDNSTQSYFNNRDVLREAHARRGESFKVSIIYDRDTETIRVADNAMGMSYDELQRALHIGLRPESDSWRSRYGMGMKTAACWLGNRWTVTTKKLGETTETSVTISVVDVAEGADTLPERRVQKADPDISYTIIEISELNNKLRGRRLGKIRSYLASMYRQDIRSKMMVLEWQNSALQWEDMDGKLLVAKDGSRYKKDYAFSVDGKRVYGWVGILAHGSRAEAGFSILHADRVVRGWPDSWRPETLYGQLQGSNDLVNQRLVGEIHLDDFEVSHTKDDILWTGEEQDQVEDKLREEAGDYRNIARRPWKAATEERGPTDSDVATAVDELKRELESEEMAELIRLEPVPSPEAAQAATENVIEAVVNRSATFDVKIGSEVEIRVFLEDRSANDPYVVSETANPARVLVVINTAHPHVATIEGSSGFLNYLRHAVYDAVAEWQASRKTTRLHPDTIKLLKDRLLRVSFDLEQNAAEDTAAS